MILTIKETICDCERCSVMCHAPCCGTVEEMEKLIDHGFTNRLMYDDWPDGEIVLKPALKGFESKDAPWETSSFQGCTFWKDGKCELHDLGLKPLGGRYAHHDLQHEYYEEIQEVLNDSWKSEKASDVIEKWKKEVNYLETQN